MDNQSMELYQDEDEARTRNSPLNRVFATYVRSQGVDSEIVNLLQGRIEKDVFVRHYNRPEFDTIIAKVRNSVESLEKLVRVV